MLPYYSVNTFILIALSMSSLLGITLVWRMAVALKKYSVKKRYTAAIEPPSVSVCIPARNERHAMTQCLERVLASDYKKMEVIVFDDNSEDDTSALIKSFAHEGVRFVPGTTLEGNWLGRNRALEILSREASGTYVIFMSVDTAIEPTTVSRLVSCMITEQKKMLSVLPRRQDMPRASALFGYLRYFWELIFADKNHPAVATALWMIDRTTFRETLGGLGESKMSVVPERDVAMKLNGQYLCLVSNAELGVNYEKRWGSQLETAKRLLFPALHFSSLRVLLAAMGLVLLVLPAALGIISLAMGDTPMAVFSFVTLSFGGLSYALYTRFAWSSSWWMALFVWPYAVLQELVFVTLSVTGYLGHTITWKGRLVARDGATSPLSSEVKN